jgi:hypothetical protein
MRRLSLIRFFVVVLRSHVTLAATAVLLLGMAAWMTRNDAQEIGQLSTLGLFVQMFAAGSGFREPARRGHFDAVLARGTSRIAVAAAHWVVSVAPGLLVWVALSAVILWVQPDEQPVGFTLAGLVAVLYVSSASWMLALPFTRYGSGVIWLLALVLLSGANAMPILREAFLAPSGGLESLLRRAGAGLACPTFLVAGGQRADDSALALILLATVLLTGAGGLFIAKSDAPLQDPS